jgi:hypothetical protein
LDLITPAPIMMYCFDKQEKIIIEYLFRTQMKIFKIIALTGILCFAVGNISAIAWRWGKPYLIHDPLAGSPRVFLWAWELVVFVAKEIAFSRFSKRALNKALIT